MSVTLGNNVNSDGKVVLEGLPILEMVSSFPELDPGVDYTLSVDKRTLSLGPLTIPENVTIEVPVGAAWVII